MTERLARVRVGWLGALARSLWPGRALAPVFPPPALAPGRLWHRSGLLHRVGLWLGSRAAATHRGLRSRAVSLARQRAGEPHPAVQDEYYLYGQIPPSEIKAR